MRPVVSAPAVSYTRNSRPATLPGLAGSASVSGKRVTLTVTNPSLDQVRETEVVVRGGTVTAVKATVLAAPDAHAHNSFEAPRAVEPKEESVALRGAMLVHRFPPASVTRLEITLA